MKITIEMIDELRSRVNVTYEEAKEVWSKRVQSLKEKGTYLVDYRNLYVELDDTYPIGRVDLVMMINGKEKYINDVSLWFGFQDRKWGLIHVGFQHIENARHHGADHALHPDAARRLFRDHVCLYGRHRRGHRHRLRHRFDQR